MHVCLYVYMSLSVYRPVTTLTFSLQATGIEISLLYYDRLCASLVTVSLVVDHCCDIGTFLRRHLQPLQICRYQMHQCCHNAMLQLVTLTLYVGLTFTNSAY